MTAVHRATEKDARRWCEWFGFEFKSWDGTFCAYRDPRAAGTAIEFGLESQILSRGAPAPTDDRS